jgi:hypothetical protein
VHGLHKLPTAGRTRVVMGQKAVMTVTAHGMEWTVNKCHEHGKRVAQLGAHEGAAIVSALVFASQRWASEGKGERQGKRVGERRRQA